MYNQRIVYVNFGQLKHFGLNLMRLLEMSFFHFSKQLHLKLTRDHTKYEENENIRITCEYCSTIFKWQSQCHNYYVLGSLLCMYLFFFFCSYVICFDSRFAIALMSSRSSATSKILIFAESKSDNDTVNK